MVYLKEANMEDVQKVLYTNYISTEDSLNKE